MNTTLWRGAFCGLVWASLSGHAAWADDFADCREKSGPVAIAACDRALGSGGYTGKKLVELYINRGQEHYLARNYDRALDDFNRGIALDATHPFLFANRGNTHRRRGAFAAALADYSAAIQLDPEFPAAYAGRGLAHEGMGNVELARRDFETALRLPMKYGDGKWAHDTARERLAALGAR
jgi:tetratricopeptide (TPR) repeat protein